MIPLLVGLVAYPLCSSPRLAFPNTMPLAAKYWLTNGALDAGKKSTLQHYIAQHMHSVIPDSLLPDDTSYWTFSFRECHAYQLKPGWHMWWDT